MTVDQQKSSEVIRSLWHIGPAAELKGRQPDYDSYNHRATVNSTETVLYMAVVLPFTVRKR
jgi:hypothetical protein